MRLPFFKKYLCNKPKIYFMKITHLHFIPSLFFFVSSCNNTKAADEKKEVEKIAVVTVDTVAINIIDTIDYNKRMQALSNNDTTEGGR
jgi:hypothetical protein